MTAFPSRFVSHLKETTHGTNIISATGVACATYKPGVVEDDIKVPWNEQKHEPVYDVSTAKPNTVVEKEIAVEFDVDYAYNNAGVWRRIFGAAADADPVFTFTVPATHDPDVDDGTGSWSWYFRTGSKAVEVRGGVTTKVEVTIEQFQPMKIRETILGLQAVDGTVLTTAPVFPTGLSNDEAYRFGDISAITMGGDTIPVPRIVNFTFINAAAPDRGGLYAYANVIKRSGQFMVLFTVTGTYEGSADNLRDKLILDGNEALVVTVLGRAGATQYVTFTLSNTQYTGMEIISKKNGTCIYSVSGHAYVSGGNYVSVAVREGVNWNTGTF